jgi:antimicrobial peptide system SdpB family protein
MINTKTDSIAANTQPWTNVYGVARTILALGTLLTLFFNDAVTLFMPNGVVQKEALPTTISTINFFFFFPVEFLDTARWIAIVILLVVISGWRPQITGIFHWWISFSFATACVIVDGGDQVTQVITLFLLPIAFTDTRKWHWSTNSANNRLYEDSTKHKILSLIALSSYFAIRLQVAIIYFHASTAKLKVEEWVNGTVFYYWSGHPVFGLNEVLKPLFMPLISNSIMVLSITWGSIILETLLFMGLVMNKRWWQTLLVCGLSFHLMIILVHGLVSFFFAMAGSLILYLRPLEQEFSMPSLTLKLFEKFPIKPRLT